MLKRLTTVVRTFRDETGVYRSVMTDPLCPGLTRILLASAVAYAMSPIDLIPDFIPVIGHLDDAIVLPLFVWFALRMIPEYLVHEHRIKCERNRGVSNQKRKN